jgi:hypothetical protein
VKLLAPVNEVKVDVVQVQSRERRVESLKRFVVVLLTSAQLGRDEDVGALDLGAIDAMTDAHFIAVGGGGVDESIAQVERRADGDFSVLVIHGPGAQTE